MNEFLTECSKAYYGGYPIISDEQFDALENREKGVGTNVSDSAIPHLHRMYSLQKVFQDENTAPDYNADMVISLKLDGAAISLLYSNGKLVLALTRGDGIKGEDITDKALAWSVIPNTIGDLRTLQITGEVVLPKKIFNARNKASGALNLKSVEEFLERECSFIMYGLIPYRYKTYEQDLNAIGASGFRTILDENLGEFPTDGLVYRIDNNAAYYKEGFTAKHPKGAYAFKTRSKGVETTILDVVWQVGKSGKVTPVAILEPIIINDATVSRATLNNMGFIAELGVEIGDTVMVERAGGVIPRIIRKVV